MNVKEIIDGLGYIDKFALKLHLLNPIPSTPTSKTQVGDKVADLLDSGGWIKEECLQEVLEALSE